MAVILRCSAAERKVTPPKECYVRKSAYRTYTAERLTTLGDTNEAENPESRPENKRDRFPHVERYQRGKNWALRLP